MKPIIHSTKHTVQYPLNPIATGVIQNITLATAVASPNKNLSTEVEEGASIKAVFVELWLQNKADDGHQIVILVKRSNNQVGATFAEMGGLFSFAEKKNIFFTHEGLSASDNGSGPMQVMGRWYKIPRSKQRFGLGDTLAITVSNPSSTVLNSCGATIYKEYT